MLSLEPSITHSAALFDIKEKKKGLISSLTAAEWAVQSCACIKWSAVLMRLFAAKWDGLRLVIDSTRQPAGALKVLHVSLPLCEMHKVNQDLNEYFAQRSFQRYQM